MSVILNKAMRFVLQNQEDAPGGVCVHLVSVVDWLKKEFTSEQINELYREIRMFSDPDVGIETKPALDALEKALEIALMENLMKTPYITSVERIGMEKGLQQGFSEMILDALDERFGEVPGEISNAVSQIEDRDKLESLHRHAIRSESLKEFRKQLDG